MPTSLISAGITGGASLLGGLFGNKQSSQEKALQGAQTANLNQQTQLSKLMGSMAQNQYSAAAPAYGQALGYYSTLLGGNRSAMQQAVAPETQSINDIYGGSERNLERMGVRGGEAATAKADLARQQAGQLASLVGGVRPGAAAQLGSLGLSGVGGAGSMAGGAAGAAGSAAGGNLNALENLQNQRNISYGNLFGLGSSLGKLFLPYLMQQSSGQQPLAGRQTVPNMGLLVGGGSGMGSG